MEQKLETIISLLTIITYLVYGWFVKDVLFADEPVLRIVALVGPMIWACIYVSLAKGWIRHGAPYTKSIHVVAQTIAYVTAIAWIGGLILIAIDKFG